MHSMSLLKTTLINNLGLSEALKLFPSAYAYAFAYGSGVFQQQNQNKGKMVDMIIVVDDPVQWHTDNIKMNRRHYSGLRFLGGKAITTVQEKFGAGVYFNPYVTVNGVLMKYGVVSTAAFEDDLKNWTSLYLAGRLHKPVLDVSGPHYARLGEAIALNRKSALHLALLLSDKDFVSKFELFHTITRISYLGDSRMLFAENPNKTTNIVTPLMEEFESIYGTFLSELRPIVLANPGHDRLYNDMSPPAVATHLNNVPLPLIKKLGLNYGLHPGLYDISEIIAELSYKPDLRKKITMNIQKIVFKSSILQTVQGVFTAGMWKSLKYAFEKLKKKRAAS